MKVTLFRDMASERWPSMQRYADELATALQREGCRVAVFSLAGPGWSGRAGALANYAWRYLVYPALARQHQGEINHILDHSYAHLLRVLDPQRTVVTCHDIAPLAFNPPGAGLSRRVWLHAFDWLFRAARIITDAEYTRNELLARRAYPSECIIPISLGVSDWFRQPVAAATLAALRKQAGADGRPLMLHVGTCEPRKNIEAVLGVMPGLNDWQPVFVQVGGRFSPAQRQQIATAGLGDVVRQVAARSDADLHAWYQAADVFVFPSYYEGFGLPVLEAMASGTPVVCSNRTSLSEVAGEAALLVDPADGAALADALRRVLAEPDLRIELVQRGRARAASFSWERTAQQVQQVYQAVATEAQARHA